MCFLQPLNKVAWCKCLPESWLTNARVLIDEGQVLEGLEGMMILQNIVLKLLWYPFPGHASALM